MISESQQRSRSQQSSKQIATTESDIAFDVDLIDAPTYAQAISKGRWYPYRHAVETMRFAQDRILRGNARLIFNEPPRHGKSQRFSHYLPTWFLDLFPQKRVILCSFEASLARTWSRKVRDEFASNPLTMTRINAANAAAHDWQTTKGGGMLAAGVNGPIIGRGGDLLIIDDPTKNIMQAESAVYQKALVDWLESTFIPRCEPNASILIVMQRWNQNDLTGYIEREHKDEDWQRVSLPAIAEANDWLGRAEGEALCPQRFDATALQRIKRGIGSSIWNGLYQQRPAPSEGAIFKFEWFNFYDRRPDRFDEVILSVDCTFKDADSSDFVVIQAWGRIGAQFYLIDQMRERMSFTVTLRALLSMIDKLRQQGMNVDAVVIEEAANGYAVIDVLKDKVPGVIGQRAEQSKPLRARAVEANFEARQVNLPSPSIAPWVDDYIQEMLQFPNAAQDDQVDATTQAVRRLKRRGAEIGDLDLDFNELTSSSSWGI